MSLPHRDQRVTFVVPSRERVPARVRDAGQGWVDVELVQALAHHPGDHPVFLHFVSGEGMERLLGRVPRAGDLGRGATVRFAHDGRSQLLKRAELVSAAVDASLHGWPSKPGAHPWDGRAISVSGGGLVVRGPRLDVGSLHQFELELTRDEPAVCGQFRVDARGAAGDAEVHFTILSPRDRARVVAACLEP